MKTGLMIFLSRRFKRIIIKLLILEKESRPGDHDVKINDIKIRITIIMRVGGGKDYVVVGTDSGKICILEYNAAKNSFDRVHIETFGKSGCRRLVGLYSLKDRIYYVFFFM